MFSIIKFLCLTLLATKPTRSEEFLAVFGEDSPFSSLLIGSLLESSTLIERLAAGLKLDAVRQSSKMVVVVD